MPIKLGKVIPRRKSSGNALEDFAPPTESSFRVLERPQVHSFDGGNSVQRRSQVLRPSLGHYSDDNIFANAGALAAKNRVSDGTVESRSSMALDNSSASLHLSDTSTIPSSMDMSLEDKSPSTVAKLRDKTRAWSLGGRKKDQAVEKPHPPLPPPPQQIPSETHWNQNRARAETESSYASESTATPPRLLDGGFDEGGLDLDFDNFGKRRSKLMDKGLPLLSESPANGSPRSPRRLDRENFDRSSPSPPFPPPAARFHDAPSSPYSWASRGSREDLISSSSPTLPDEHHQSIRAGFGLHSSRTPPHQSPSTPLMRNEQERPTLGGNRKDGAHASIGAQDTQDIKLLRNSQAALRGLDRRSMTFDEATSRSYDPRLTSHGQDTGSPSSHGTTIARKSVQLTDSVEAMPRFQQRPSSAPREEESMFDQSSLPSAADITRQHRLDVGPQPVLPKKVMTPAQFEQYKKEQERIRKAAELTTDSTDDDSGDDYDDDDDVEREKEAAKQRRKQEAHLAVYRQQMMKVTGETPSDLPKLRTGFDKMNSSTPQLAHRANTPTLSLNDGPPQRSSDDEDEEVPLGILAAHGFPSKARPPTVGAPGTTISFRSETYPPPSSTTGGSHTLPLPAFARKLPQDPYYGAGLVNQANRESLAFGNRSPASVCSGSFPPQQGAPHPAGLVGVIAGEERARAARRGSPNTQGGYNQVLPQGMQAPTMESNQQQMAQMNQFMQTQMQFMHQMQAMMSQGMPMGQPPPLVPPHMQQPMAGNGYMTPQMAQQQQQMMMMQSGLLGPQGQMMPRPLSHSAPSSPAAATQGPRSQSMLSSSPMPWGAQQERRGSYAPSMMSGVLGSGPGPGPGPGPGYTPSIAPSERSNIGMPLRYRPVSIAPSAMGDEAPMTNARPGSAMSMSSHNLLQPGRSQLNVPVPNPTRPASQVTHGSNMARRKKQESESDEEEGWEEMKAKRDAKKLERLGKKQGSLMDVYVPVPNE